MRSQLLRARLNEVFVFAAAARTGSFSKAARELGMTQSAVSHHVASLEAMLGTRLFDRIWRGIALTEAGRELYQAAGRAFRGLADGLAAAARAQNSRQITIHTDFAVAAYYLMPRLGHLREAADGADIRILTSQAPSIREPHRLDCGIIFGSAGSLGPEAVPLTEEVVVPVASPAVARDLHRLTAETLPTSRLLRLESETGDWLDWNGYAALAKLPRPDHASGLTFNNYQMLIEAALLGDGVALGWRPLVDRLLEMGHLVPVGPLVMRPRWGYFLLQAAPVPSDSGFGRLLKLIRSDFAEASQNRPASMPPPMP
jgi:LysR family transcriptional regulator, glycine cleavage system transcriptional activator